MFAFHVQTRASTCPLKPGRTVRIKLNIFKSAFPCLKLKIPIVDVSFFIFR